MALGSIGLHWREDFKGVGVSGNGGEALVPQPACRVLGAFHSCDCEGARHLRHLLQRDAFQDLCSAGADDEQVTGAEFDPLMRGTGFEVVRGYTGAIEGVEGDALVLGVGLVVNKYAASDKATALVPVVESGSVLGGRGRGGGEGVLGSLEAIVGETRRLVLEVTETVPLAAALGVEGELVVPGDACVGAHGLGEVEDLVLRGPASRDGELGHGVERPAEFLVSRVLGTGRRGILE